MGNFELLNKKSTTFLVGMFVLFIMILYFMGRIPQCTCGFGIWTTNTQSSDTSQLFADPYSFSHILHGILFFAILKFFFRKLSISHILLLSVAIEMGWEILENTPFIIERYRAET